MLWRRGWGGLVVGDLGGANMIWWVGDGLSGPWASHNHPSIWEDVAFRALHCRQVAPADRPHLETLWELNNERITQGEGKKRDDEAWTDSLPPSGNLDCHQCDPIPV